MEERPDEVIGEVAIDLVASPDVVYAYLVDFTRHPEWVANLSKVIKLTDGAMGVGTRFRAGEGVPPASPVGRARMILFVMLGLLTGAKPFSEAEITALEPGRRIAWRAYMPRRGGNGTFNQSEWQILLEPRDGGTHLVQRFRYLPQHWAARGMVGQATDVVASTASNLARLKARFPG
jgi:uncharacterized protein YndB with AHSA1/START domain